ncbi:MAG: dTMP kinase [Bacteroidota bacterium]|nr:dTMP kinase [Bacteroidota bacterium]
MKFLVIEGLDGAGKSTQVRMLKNWFSEQGIPFEYIHFPRVDSPVFGDLVGRYLRGDLGKIEDVNPYLVALLFAGDQKDASSQIHQWLKESKYVLVDRYVYSNIAYQCAKFKTEKERNNLLHWILKTEFDHFHIPEPDVSIYLDVPHDFVKSQLMDKQRVGSERDYLKGKDDIHEANIDYQLEVRKIYEMMIKEKIGLEALNCEDKMGKMLPAEVIFEKLIDLLKNKDIV